jgi:alpha-beta hydrolase superfamily lysophospholipase
MTTQVELTVDVTEAAGLGQPAHTAVTVVLPPEPPEADRLDAAPVTCFAFPGGGYCRRYFTFDMPGASGGGQAAWHASRGWIVVAIDHLATGDSTRPEPERLTYEDIARVNVATVEVVSARLAEGTVADGYPPVEPAVRLGIGQSMGGCLLTVAQAHHGTFDGIGVLGSSAVHTVVPTRPGTPPVPLPWVPRGSDPASSVVLNRAAMEAALSAPAAAAAAATVTDEHPFTWAFHYDDEPADVVAEDMAAFAGMALDGDRSLPAWRSATAPTCAGAMVSPGTIAAEAAAVTVPVFVGVGERDVVPDPWIEPKAYKSATDVSLFVCPRMAHMHNFASTRERLWARLHAWGDGIATFTHSDR